MSNSQKNPRTIKPRRAPTSSVAGKSQRSAEFEEITRYRQVQNSNEKACRTNAGQSSGVNFPTLPGQFADFIDDSHFDGKTISQESTTGAEVFGHSVVALRLCSSVRPNKLIGMGQKIVLGRMDDEPEIPFDPRMSRRHFSIECTLHGGVIEDLNSTNGTLLNGKRIVRAELNHQDQVVAGMTIFIVEFVDSINGC